MSRYIIEGGNRLQGEIKLQGAKNSALPLLAGALLIKGKVVLHNCPDLSDVRAALRILEFLGCSCSWNGEVVCVDASNVSCCEVPEELMREMRSSVVFLGSILSRCSLATITAPGGCELGPRPIDLHLKAMEELGFSVTENGGKIYFERVNTPKSVSIYLDFPSVGATENIILASAVSDGRVTVRNAAREPEISDLADFINRAGGKVLGAGSDHIEIIGVKKLNSVEHSVIPDRIAAATYMSAAAVTGGSITVNGVDCSHLTSVISSFRSMGCSIKTENSRLNISAAKRLNRISAVRSSVYPGFPTDAGPLLVASLIKAKGTSVFTENIFENRFNYIGELRRLGADIKVFGKVAVIEGVDYLRSAYLSCTDLRGGAAAAIALLGSDGVGVLDNISHIERGYENFEGVLSGVSAKIVKE